MRPTRVLFGWVARTVGTFVVILTVLVGVGYAKQYREDPSCAELPTVASSARGTRDAAIKARKTSDWFWAKGELVEWWKADDVADSLENDAKQLEERQRNLEAVCGPADQFGLVGLLRSSLPVAVGIMVGILLVPLGIKAVFYFWFAPIAERLPPITLLPSARAHHVPMTAPAVSLPIDIGDTEELLVHPDFIQSSSRSARKRTQWFLNPRIPLSSLASGMVSLTRVRAEGSNPTRIVVSPQSDPLGELFLVELPQGAAMVIQPRSLAGVVKPIESVIEVTPKWRLTSLHAWLTLQLRYLVFHGPCKLIVKGCRGVRIEMPESGRPRLINQSSTLGFSANLEYSCSRCETFVSYLRGQEALFNDMFGGGPGVFIYEEIPDVRERTGITGRGLEGLTDGVLKVFGI